MGSIFCLTCGSWNIPVAGARMEIIIQGRASAEFRLFVYDSFIHHEFINICNHMSATYLVLVNHDKVSYAT